MNLSADIGKAEHKSLWHYEQALLEMREMLESEGNIVLCKDCKKHNVKMGFDENGHTVWKEDSCPLILFRGKAQGHEFDYQYCIYGERK